MCLGNPFRGRMLGYKSNKWMNKIEASYQPASWAPLIRNLLSLSWSWNLYVDQGKSLTYLNGLGAGATAQAVRVGGQGGLIPLHPPLFTAATVWKPDRMAPMSAVCSCFQITKSMLLLNRYGYDGSANIPLKLFQDLPYGNNKLASGNMRCWPETLPAFTFFHIFILQSLFPPSYWFKFGGNLFSSE